MEIALDNLSRRDWEGLVPAPAMQQGWAYGAACAALGSRVLRFEMKRRSETVGLAQVVHRRLFGCLDAFVCTRGPLWIDGASPEDRATGLRRLRKAAEGGRLKGVFVTPDATDSASLRGSGMIRVMTPYTTACIDLTLEETTLRAAMHHKWRNRLVASERAELRVTRVDRRPELFRWVLEAEEAQQRSRRYQALPPALVAAWHQATGEMRVLVAEHQDQQVGAMVFLIHGRQATYHLGWASPEGKRLSAHNLLLWQGMRKLKAAGIEMLDLGGLNTEDIPGIARFKLGAGAAVKTLCGTWFGR
ncbi:MAG: lipid II:glycine glycyltransferase FemX [Paracoccaceae bacterium]